MGRKGTTQRTAIAPGETFQMQVTLLRGYDETTRRKIAAAFWLLGHLGSGGSRNRRGFGSLALKSVETKPENAWPEMRELPLLCETPSLNTWASDLMKTLDTFKSWFGEYQGDFHHPHLGPQLKLLPMAEEFSKSDWAGVLNLMGSLFQEYRQRREPDYTDVKDHLLAFDKRRGAYLEYTPQRAAFGLPLQFRYSSLPEQMRRKSLWIVPFDTDSKMRQLDRHGSLLFLRPVLVNDRLYPLFFRLDGDIPGQTPPGSVQNWRTPLSPWRANAMDDFLSWLKTR